VSRQLLAEAAADLAAYLRFQERLGLNGLRLSPEARAALERLDEPLAAEPDSPAGGPPPDLAELARQAAACRRCDLSKSRSQVVFGEGDPRAELMFIGEGPGHEEDLSGRPFVGPAGKLLGDIIKAMGLSRERVYIANIVKCRPPGNRTPRPEEAAACRPWLQSQLDLIRPKAVIALGACAAQNLLATSQPISKLRGRFHDLEGIPVMPTFHPAYLLRNYSSDNRRKVWSDAQQVMDRLGLKRPS